MASATRYQLKGIEAWVLEPGECLLEGITRLADEREVRRAVVLSGIGSLATLAVRNPVAASSPPPMVSLKETGPFELLSVTGTIGRIGVEKDSIRGKVHIHVMVSGKDGRAIGGSLEDGSKVFLGAQLTVALFEPVGD